MIKEGRPYSNENGYIDTELVTSLVPEDMMIVGEWIRNNVRKSEDIHSMSSYGLKHVLEKDTKLYLTNNQFKDAMLLSGFYPVDEDELNWKYRIVLKKDIIYNPSPFFEWLKQFLNKDNRYGDFAHDVCYDKYFPVFAEYNIIKKYLEREWHANSGINYGIMVTFAELWKMYEESKRKGR
jgi:uncharacterized protein YozE (UPF0346 family)